MIRLITLLVASMLLVTSCMSAAGNKPHYTPNGLLNGLAFYWKAHSDSVTVGSGPLVEQHGDAFVFHGRGPVSGEGSADVVSPAFARAPEDDLVFSDFGSTDFLVSFWINPSAAARPFSEIISCGPTPANGWDAWIADDLSVGWEIPLADQSYPSITTVPGSVRFGTWYNVIIWWTGDDKTLHGLLNGVDMGTAVGDGPSGAPEPGNQLDIGGSYTGILGPVGIWKGTIPDAAGRAALAAGTGYAAFTN